MKVTRQNTVNPLLFAAFNFKIPIPGTDWRHFEFARDLFYKYSMFILQVTYIHGILYSRKNCPCQYCENKTLVNKRQFTVLVCIASRGVSHKSIAPVKDRCTHLCISLLLL